VKIYNKKGLFLGALWTLLGVCFFSINIFSPEDFFAKQVKGIVVSVVLILMGVSEFARAFSKEATQNDRIEKHDERNNLLKLKTKTLTLNILYGCLVFVIVVGLTAYGLTSNTALISTVTVAGGSLSFVLLMEIIISIYYEKHM
jgi:hypothetical protein